MVKGEYRTRGETELKPKCPPPPMPLNVGDSLRHFDVTALLGEGGTGHPDAATV